MCTAAAANPECQKSDCLQLSVEGFHANGDEFSGIITYSPSAGTISSIGNLVKRTYTVMDNQVHVDGTNATAVATCDGQRLQRNYSTDGRPAAEVSSALEMATAAGATSFHSVRVSQ